MKFRAAVLDQVGSRLSVETLQMADLAADDVLVRNGASGLCHTDLEVIEGSLAYPMPIVLGHEGAGVVEEIGLNVSRVKVGDHVILSWNPHCGQCFYCERDLPILCEPFARHQPKGLMLDGKPRLSRNGETVHHYSVMSSHSEMCVVPESGAIVVSKDIPFDLACIIGCGVMTGVGATVRKAPVAAGSNVLVLGCGPVGLNAIQGARMMHAEQIIAVDVSPARLELAETLGATDTLDARTVDTVDEVRKRTGGRGADHVFEAAGNANVFRTAVEAVRPGGSVVFLGKINVEAEVKFRWGSLMGEKQIVRSSYGGARPSRDFPWLVNEYLRGNLLLDELVTRRLTLDEINDGFDAMRRGEGIRSVIVFDS
jgi:S-(hydroxymethyl)glutathione dehydrogenase/alcohol dehydrogenase